MNWLIAGYLTSILLLNIYITKDECKDNGAFLPKAILFVLFYFFLMFAFPVLAFISGYNKIKERK